MRRLLLALVLVALAGFVAVPRLGDGDDVVLQAPAGTDPAVVVTAVTARLADAGLVEVDVARRGRRIELTRVHGSSRDLVLALRAAYRLHVRPVEGECETAERPDRTDPAAPVDLPVRPPATPSCLRLGAAVAGNEAIRRTQASGTDVVIRFGDLPLGTSAEWAVEVDGEVLTSPRVASTDEGFELVVDGRTRQGALALAAGLVHPLPAHLRD